MPIEKQEGKNDVFGLSFAKLVKYVKGKFEIGSEMKFMRFKFRIIQENANMLQSQVSVGASNCIEVDDQAGMDLAAKEYQKDKCFHVEVITFKDDYFDDSD